MGCIVYQSSGRPLQHTDLWLTLRSGSRLALGACILAATGLALSAPVSAQTFGYWDTPTYYKPRKPKKAKRPPAQATEEAASKKKSKGETVAERQAEGPLVINVSLNRQRLTVYDVKGPIASSPVSE